MKGVAMILVVLDHSGFLLHPFFDLVEVPVFYFISGYLFRSGQQFGPFLTKKVKRIVVPYLCFCLLFAWPYLSHTPAGDLTLKSFLLYVVAVPVNYPLWFLKAVFIAYILFYWLERLTRPGGLWMLGGAALIWAVAATFISNPDMDVQIHPLYVSALPQGFVAVPVMALGYFAARLHGGYDWQWLYKPKGIALIVGIIAAMGATLTFTMGSRTHLYVADLGNPPGVFYLNAALSVAIFSVLCWVVRRWTPLLYVGRHSIAVMGVHALFIFIAVEVMALPQWTVPLVAMALSLVVVEALRRYLPILSG